MPSRRQLFGTSVIMCGCALCAGFAFGADAATGEAPTEIAGPGYRLWFVGAQRDTIMNGKLAAALDLRTLAAREHLYGLGPLAQLRGEVTIAGGRSALARVGVDNTVQVTQSFDAGVPFFVWAEVPRWRELALPPGVRTFAELEEFVPQAAAAAGLDADKPLPFLVDTRQSMIEFHVLNRIGDGPHNMEAHKRIQATFELASATATIVGFHSRSHRGIFTPGDSNIHIHFQARDSSASGHIQHLQLGMGSVLSLPSA
jgi:acetolactate decarboxylase